MLVRSGRWRRVLVAMAAAVFVVVGVTLVACGVASAGPRVFITIKIWPSAHDATLKLPTPVCPPGYPSCQWMLLVFERDGATQTKVIQTLVGTTTGTSGVLTVSYPSDYCGQIQADAMVHLIHWRFKGGRRLTVGGTGCPAPPPSPTGPTSPPGPTALPVTSGPNAPAAVTGPGAAVVSEMSPTRGGVSPAPPVVAQLPFTGLDVRPLAGAGLALIVFGLCVLSTLEQRRRAILRLRHVLRPSTARCAASAFGWLLGD